MDLPRFSWRRNAVLAIAMVSSLSLSVALASEPAYAEDLADTKAADEAALVESVEVRNAQNTNFVFSGEHSTDSSNETSGEPGGEPSGDEASDELGGEPSGDVDGEPSGDETLGEQGGDSSDGQGDGQPGNEPSGELGNGPSGELGGEPSGNGPSDELGGEPSSDDEMIGEQGEELSGEKDDEGEESKPEIKDGWVEQDGKKYWYVDGVPVKNSTVVDPETGAKYWASEDGSIVTGEDVYVPRDPSTVDAEQWASSEEYRAANGKWIRLEDDGKMVLGEDYYNGHWYYFDPITGEMMKNFTFHSGKWVYYDDIMGWMLYGEQYRPASKTDTQLHWYYFDEWTGATSYKWRYVSQGASGKWVYYDDYMGWMVYGEQYRPANSSDTQLHWYYFDEWTGATTYRWKYIASQNKTVYYDDFMGWMIYGWRDTGDHQYGVGTNWHFFDRYTGALMTANDRNNSAHDCYINIQGGTSKTPYYIVVDKNNFRTVIFHWSGSDWDVAKVFRCGLGRPEANLGRGTQEGFYYLGENVPYWPIPSSEMWRANYDRMYNDTSAGVKYRVHYLWDQGFHSTVYTSSTPAEQQLERYISDGCVRLLEEDAAWLYNTCANGTRVYIFSRR